MALSSVIDSDARFVVNGITRIISNNSSGKTVLIQGDHNSERLTFQVPRHVDGFDLSTCNVVQIHYINVSADKTKQGSDVYEVDDLAISSEDENAVTLSWLISSNATRYAGTLNFLIKFKCVNNAGKVVYVWNTATFTGISVSSGIDNGEVVVEEYSDILESWRKKISYTAPDWNAAADEEGYIKNRTHYTDPDGTVHKLDNKYIDAEWMARKVEKATFHPVIPEQKLTNGMWKGITEAIVVGLTYHVNINGVKYTCVACTDDEAIYLGNPTLGSADLPHNNEPFCIVWAGGSATMGMFLNDDSLSYPLTMGVTQEFIEKVPAKLPKEYLPDDIGGSANIDVTATVGQTIIVKEVDANGKPTKWESADYQEKIFGKKKMTFLETTEVSFVTDEESGLTVAVIPFTGRLEENVVYTVTFNGVTYENTYDPVMTAIGNIGALTGGENTGEPYIIATSIETLTLNVILLEEMETATISISVTKDFQIDEKYLPKTKTLDLGSYDDAQDVLLTDDQLEILESAAKKGVVHVVGNFKRGTSNIVVRRFSASITKSAGVYFLSGTSKDDISVYAVAIEIKNDGDGWYVDYGVF